ncbi:hypothetical protein MML48_1g01845 [Holotrichia oblita]|uniref:Uncharacterized protein n=2 Tax=Holotrichia oblita TaxID=644536 RepID=A0ACB9TZD1_HOLOL|nr:hypothetical protein MML48_1g13868 [Holotrichia oblita]KAI4472122.1 hypothetical protein MML48_1g01845 [Holotrichia oblita]
MAENIKRSNNFSNSEGRLLIELVEKNKDIIECKRTDTDNNRKKTDTWKAIEKEFNSLSGQTFTDVKVLKNKYENIKKRTKKKVSDNKINIMGTGGGPSQDAELTDIDNTIIGMLGARVEGYPSAFAKPGQQMRMSVSTSTPSQSETAIEVDLSEMLRQLPPRAKPTKNLNAKRGKPLKTKTVELVELGPARLPRQKTKVHTHVIMTKMI